MKTIRWGIIGCGDVTEIKSGPAYQNTKGFELLYVMRRDKNKLVDYAKRHKVSKYTTSASELINDPEIDAIYIATPPDTHLEYGLQVATVGKICCVEKPMTTNYPDSLKLQKAFEEKNLPLFVAYYRRSLPRFNKVKEWIETSKIGDIRHIRWDLMRPPHKQDTSEKYIWRTDAKIAPGGYFDDLACHGLDLFNYLLGDIKQVSGFSTSQNNYYSAKDAMTASWIHPNNITGSGNWNFNCDRYEDWVEIYGSKGKIEFSIFQEKPIVLDSNSKKEELFIENPKHIQQYHVENMLKHISDQTFNHPSTGKTGMHANWLMDQILKN